jgi:hypothetical protein
MKDGREVTIRPIRPEEEEALRNISAKSSRLDKQDAWGPSPARDFQARRSCRVNRDLSRVVVNAVRTRHQGVVSVRQNIRK